MLLNYSASAESIYYAWAFYETTQFWAVPPNSTFATWCGYLLCRPQKPQKGFDLLQKIALDAFTILLGIYFLHEVAFGNKKCVFSYCKTPKFLKPSFSTQKRLRNVLSGITLPYKPLLLLTLTGQKNTF